MNPDYALLEPPARGTGHDVGGLKLDLRERRLLDLYCILTLVATAARWLEMAPDPL